MDLGKGREETREGKQSRSRTEEDQEYLAMKSGWGRGCGRITGMK